MSAMTVSAHAAPWPVRAVIVTTFEVGHDTGDAPGEAQFWIERLHLTEKLDFPGGTHPILASPDHRIVLIETGMSLINAGISTMALGLDPRFDLKQAYWLVAGIGGIDPAAGAIGSAVWVQHTINDTAQEIDLREAPKGWAYARYVSDTHGPGTLEGAEHDLGPDGPYPLVFTLNPDLTQFAWRHSRDKAVAASDDMKRFGVRYGGAAAQPPSVLLGDSFASDIYWHGAIQTHYAEDWVKLLTHGAGRFMISDMEDSAVAEALWRLNRMGRASFDRLMILRTASNYTVQPPGETAIQSVLAPYPGGGKPAFEAAFRAGNAVLDALLATWPAMPAKDTCR